MYWVLFYFECLDICTYSYIIVDTANFILKINCLGTTNKCINIFYFIYLPVIVLHRIEKKNDWITSVTKKDNKNVNMLESILHKQIPAHGFSYLWQFMAL